MKKLRRSKIVYHPDFLRERAKVHIRASEWSKALSVINISLDKKDEDELEAYYKANKHLLLLRIQIRLALCQNEGALEDAQNVMSILTSDDPVFAKTLRLKGDALYQMGKMEHALMYYHRAKRAKTGNNEEYKIRVQMAVEAIKDSLIKPSKKTKFKINIEDSNITNEHRLIKTTELKISKEHDRKIAGNSQLSFCGMSKDPFLQDMKELQTILSKIQKEKQGLHRKLVYATKDTIDYLGKRQNLWNKHSSSTSEDNLESNE